MLISYAQNGEDVILRRVLGTKTSGFYIDVGACWPDNGSVTKVFYDAGWSGINIEPHPRTFAALEKQRSRDVNLQVALSSKEGKGVLYEGQSEGESSTVGGRGGEHFDIDVWTLQKVCGLYVTKQIDFLKIDVEGDELEVLRGGDFINYRPAVILCEVSQPWSNIKRQGTREIDLFLLDKGYRSVYFDGLNTYYAAQERADLNSEIWFQPNPIDRFVTSREAELGARIKALLAEKQNADDQAARLAAEFATREAELGVRIEANVQEIVRLNRVVFEQSAWGEACIRDIKQLTHEISSLRLSTSWRLTQPLRNIGDVLKRGLSAVRCLPGAIMIRTARIVRLWAPRVYMKLVSTHSVRRIYKPFSVRLLGSSFHSALATGSRRHHIAPAALPELTESHDENRTSGVETTIWSKNADHQPKSVEAGLMAVLSQTSTGRRIHA